MSLERSPSIVERRGLWLLVAILVVLWLARAVIGPFVVAAVLATRSRRSSGQSSAARAGRGSRPRAGQGQHAQQHREHKADDQAWRQKVACLKPGK